MCSRTPPRTVAGAEVHFYEDSIHETEGTGSLEPRQTFFQFPREIFTANARLLW